LYNILIEFGVSMKLVRLIKMCLIETYNKIRIGKHLSDNFLIQNGPKQEDVLQLELKCNGTCQLLAYADVMNLLGHSILIVLAWTKFNFSKLTLNVYIEHV
jgi:hypothetical protein